MVVAVLLIFGAIEATQLGGLNNCLLTTVIFLAVIAGAILVIEFCKLILLLAVVVVVISMIRDNLRELRQV